MPAQRIELQLVITGLAQAKAQVANALSSSGTVGTPSAKAASAGAAGAGISIGSMAAAYLIMRVARSIVSAFENVIKAAEDMSQEILNIRDVMGSTFGQASTMSSLFNIAGMSGIQGTRLAERVAKNSLNPQARGTMRSIGVNPTDNGLDNLNKIIDKLRGIQDGTIKSAKAIKIFGIRGYAEILPILRMSQDIYGEAQKLADAWKPEFADKLEHFKEKVAILGQAFIIDFAVPILMKVLPVLEMMIDSTISLLDEFKVMADWLDNNMPKKFMREAADAIGQAMGFGSGFGGAIFDKMFAKNDKIEENTRRAADTLDDLHATIIGGGRNAARAWAETEIDYALNLRNRIGFA